MSIPDDLSRSQLEHAIDEWIIGKNAERNRQIVRRRLIDGITYERLAEECGLSVSQVKRVLEKDLPIVFNHIKMA